MSSRGFIAEKFSESDDESVGNYNSWKSTGSSEKEQLFAPYNSDIKSSDESSASGTLSYVYPQTNKWLAYLSKYKLYRALRWLIHKIAYQPGLQLDTIQIHFWAMIIGVLGGLINYVYRITLVQGIHLTWTIIPRWLHDDLGLFPEKSFPLWNYIWMVAILLSFIASIVTVIVRKIPSLKSTGTLADTLDKVHSRGYIGFNHFLPMFVISSILDIGGSSAGPEASVIIMGGAIGSKIGRLLGQYRTTLRVLTLCGMASGVAGFFTLPLGGAIFAMELPHTYGLQYYEAVTPAIVSSIMATVIMKAMSHKHLGGEFRMPEVPVLQADSYVYAFILGILSAIIAVVWGKSLKKIKEYTYPILKKTWGCIVLMTLGGVAVGGIGMFWPQTLFWSEFELQTLFERGKISDPEPSIPEFVGSVMNDLKLNTVPWDIGTFIQIGVAKLLVLGFSIVCGFPGGALFPLFYAGAAFGWAFSLISGATPTLCILSVMGALEVAILRTPWATSIILLQLQGGYLLTGNTTQALGVMALLPVLTITITTSLFATGWLRMYPVQRNRDDVVLNSGAPRIVNFTEDRDDYSNRLRMYESEHRDVTDFDDKELSSDEEEPARHFTQTNVRDYYRTEIITTAYSYQDKESEMAKLDAEYRQRKTQIKEKYGRTNTVQ